MITIVCVPDNRWIFDGYLAGQGAALRPLVRQLTYEELFRAGTVEAGTWIFTGIDRLGAGGRRQAAYAARELQQAGARVLNDPARVQLRYDLLARLHADGVNGFRAARVAECRGLRFPVFLREANQHNGALTPLLYADDVVQAWLHLLRLEGYSDDELLAVEFLDMSSDGLFRKYSAFVVDGEVIPRHAQASHRWMVKSSGRRRTDALAAEERDYLLHNPDAPRLAPIAASAGVDYGRIDYSRSGDRFAVWEINTAPSIGGRMRRKARGVDHRRYRTIQAEGRSTFYQSFARALASLDTPVTRTVDVDWAACPGGPDPAGGRPTREDSLAQRLLRRANRLALTHAVVTGIASVWPRAGSRRFDR